MRTTSLIFLLGWLATGIFATYNSREWAEKTKTKTDSLTAVIDSLTKENKNLKDAQLNSTAKLDLDDTGEPRYRTTVQLSKEKTKKYLSFFLRTERVEKFKKQTEFRNKIDSPIACNDLRNETVTRMYLAKLEINADTNQMHEPVAQIFSWENAVIRNKAGKAIYTENNAVPITTKANFFYIPKSGNGYVILTMQGRDSKKVISIIDDAEKEFEKMVSYIP